MGELEINFCKALFEWKRDNFPGTQAELGEFLGVSQSQVAKLLSGSRAGNETWRRKVAKKIGIPYEVMIGLHKTPSFFSQSAILSHRIEKPVDYVSPVPFISIPLCSLEELPDWLENSEEKLCGTVTDSFLVCARELQDRANHRLVACKIHDDSMSPLILPDTILIIDLDHKSFSDNRIYALHHHQGKINTTIIRRVRKLNDINEFLMTPGNSHYPPEVKNMDWQNLCIGRVVWMWGSLIDR